ncbi:MAG: hypothetical protein ACTSRG_26130 [Candidatus Helarchaeota archaeon]
MMKNLNLNHFKSIEDINLEFGKCTTIFLNPNSSSGRKWTNATLHNR